MDTKEKSNRLIDTARTLDKRKYYIFSDMGNLNVVSDIQRLGVWMCSDFKPKGLWYGTGCSWIAYLIREIDPKDASCWAIGRLNSYSHIYEIKLNTKKMVFLNNQEKFIEFTKKYKTSRFAYDIEWEQVYKDGWHGIHVSTMPKYFEDKYPWYCGWDVAGGCIFSPDAVKEITLVKKWVATWEEH